jgi:hypothetical protein
VTPLGGGRFILGEGGTDGFRVDVRESIHLSSKVYRVTLQARDARGAVSETSRTIHVIPYDHAPSVTSIQVSGGTSPGQEVIYQVLATDPDGTSIWDPHLWVQGDLDGDGTWDTDWMWIGREEPIAVEVRTRYPEAGTYEARFRARDGFWATGSSSVSVTIE